MADNLKPEDRRRTMQAVRGKGTKLERRLCSMLAGMRIKGWRKNADDVIGKPDVVFSSERVAIFVDGCFWHGCPKCKKKLPQTNRDYWVQKIERNARLAKSHNRKLANEGWIVVRIWEHEINDPKKWARIKSKINQALGIQQMNAKTIKQECRQILNRWIASCTRGGKISRNTVAVGIVVLDHLRQNFPASKDIVISKGGEIKGARSGLGNILEKYGIPGEYLKEVTTRQGHQDGQRLFEDFDWGKKLIGLSESGRDQLLLKLIKTLSKQASDWLKRQNLKLDIDRRQAPSAWVHLIVENAKQRSGGVVEQHLIGAKLERRLKGIIVANHPAHAGDRQTAREGDFTIAEVVYHVTATPSRNVIQKCAANIKIGLRPILLVPNEQENRARVLAQEEGIEKQMDIISIEGFIACNIIELAMQETKDFFTVLQEIVQIYNKRLAEVETDVSLQIEVH